MGRTSKSDLAANQSPSEPNNAPKNAPTSFEAAMQELEQLVQSMENGSLTLDASLTAYKRGAQLMQFCQQTLAQAEQEISVLQGDTLQPWTPDAAANLS